MSAINAATPFATAVPTAETEAPRGAGRDSRSGIRSAQKPLQDENGPFVYETYG